MPAIASTPSSNPYTAQINNTTVLIDPLGNTEVPVFPSNLSNSLSGILPSIVATATTASVSSSQTNLINYTPVSVVGTYRLTGTISTTSGTNTGNTTCTVVNTNAAGTSQTFLPPFSQTGSATLLTAATVASKTFSIVPYVFTTDNSGTAITVSTTVSGTVAEYISVVLERLV